MPEADVGIIGGSGLYQIEGLSDVEHVNVTTPYGSPSDSITTGLLEGVRVAFLPRHGRGHRLLPSEVPYRANVFALKTLGVHRLVSVSAVGSLREDYRPMDMALPDQLYDHTKSRPSTFFGEGIVAHIPFADPFCPHLRAVLGDACESVVERTHQTGTYVCIEGPAFSTRAESESYRRLGFDVIGMTALPEARLAREAGICYAVLAQVTDYDCWHPDHESVTAEMVMANVARNVVNSKEILRRALPAISGAVTCDCAAGVASAIATDQTIVPPEVWARLDVLIARGEPQKLHREEGAR